MLISCKPGASIWVGIVAPFLPACPASAQNRRLLQMLAQFLKHTASTQQNLVRAESTPGSSRFPLPDSNQLCGVEAGDDRRRFQQLKHLVSAPSGVGGACGTYLKKDDSAGSFFITCSRRVNKPLFPSQTKLLKENRNLDGRLERLTGEPNSKRQKNCVFRPWGWGSLLT